MKVINKLDETIIQQAKKLYDEAFNDPIPYRENLFNNYLKNALYFGVVNDDNILVMQTFFVPKRVIYLEQKMNAYLVFAVAVKKEFQNQGLMKKYLGKFIDEVKFGCQIIFLQAYNYDIYKSFDFLPCTYKKDWFLRKDQFLKVDNIIDKIDYDLINKINIKFLKENKIDNFIYKTEKENKKYLKLYLDCDAKIIMSNKSYLIYDEATNKILEYAYLDLKDFIKLVSSLPFGTTITSIIDFDKRYFTLKNDKYVFTKMLNSPIFESDQEIFFLDNW